MSNSNNTAADEQPEETEVPMEEILKEDSITHSRILKNRKSIIKKMVEERKADGMDPASAQKEVEELVEKILQQKKEEETLLPGEFDHDFLKVYLHDAFLGTVSLGTTKVPDFEMPTAYIGTRPNGRSHEIILGFNPRFFRKLNSEQKQGVIKHELYHMIFQHIFDRAVGDKEYQTLWNWATDLAINSIIGKDNLPDACLIPGHACIDPKTGKETPGPYAAFIKNAEPMLSSDYYFEELRKIKDEKDKNGDKLNVSIGSGMGTMDDHGKWDELPDDVKDVIKDKVNDMLEKAVKKAEMNNDWGSVPYEIQQQIKKLLSREVDWRSIVRNFLGRCRTMERISTIRRINKKIPYMFPGVKRKYVATFAVFLDQSGSMSDDDIALFFSELESLAQHVQIDVYHFDTQVDEKSHTVWSKGKPFPKPHRTRCGGTDFQAVADFCNKKENRGRHSGVIMLTDGYAPSMGQIIGARVMWVITEHGTMDAVRPGDLVCKMRSDEKFKAKR